MKRSLPFLVWAVVLLSVAACLPAWALEPSLRISQYGQTTWRIQEGFLRGLPEAVPPTTDGYLWIGTCVWWKAGQRAILTTQSGLPCNELYTLIQDDENNFWVFSRCGIDADILEVGGRQDHWGLQGMRERARKISAQLEIWSRQGVGTEVELRVPASATRPIWRFFSRVVGRGW